MIVDEAFFKGIEQEKKASGAYSAGIILPNGEYLLTENHLQTLIELANQPKEEVWEMIPKEDSPLFFMIAYTGCVITDYEACVGLAMNEQQKKTYQTLVDSGVLQDKYYDITNERKKQENRI